MTDSSLPASVEAERSVLGCILVRDSAALREARCWLSERSWYVPAHRRLWTAFEALDVAGAALDLVTVSNILDGSGDLESVGGASYISKLMDGIPRLINLEHYCRIVRSHEIRRATIAHGDALMKRAVEDDIEAVLVWSTERTLDLNAGVVERADEPFEVAIGEALDDIERRANKGGPLGIETGFPDLDYMTAGFEGGDLVILAGRTSSGKTSLAVNIVRHVAFKIQKRVLYYSFEMSRQQVATRIACQEGGWDLLEIRRGKPRERDVDAMPRVFSRLRNAPLIIDTRAAPISVLADRTRKRHRQQPLGLVVLDYMGLVPPERGKRESATQDMTAVAHGCKGLAMELGVPVLALAQLSRAPEGGGSGKRRRPMLSDLRQSGDIENDADVVMLVYREEQGDETKPKTGDSELIVAKQRNGPPGIIKLYFEGRSACFKSVDRRPE